MEEKINLMDQEITFRTAPLFSKNILIKGKHATYMKALSNKFNSDLKQGMFKRNLDVYLVAPIVGKIFNRKAKPNNENDETSIHTEQLIEEMDRLIFNYRLITFLEKRDTLSFEERSNKAFRYDNDKQNRELCENVFYEKLIVDATSIDDYILNNYKFMKELDEDYIKLISEDELIELFKVAGN